MTLESQYKVWLQINESENIGFEDWKKQIFVPTLTEALIKLESHIEKSEKLKRDWTELLRESEK